jgi:transcriptional regulator with XRE-family HTH domain
MYSNPQKRSEPEAQMLRREAGRWLKQKREERDFSQRQLAEMLGIEYYTFISQLETGRGRIPPERYVDWANALGIEPKEFVYSLMRYYDPVTFAILFGDADKDTLGKDFG